MTARQGWAYVTAWVVSTILPATGVGAEAGLEGVIRFSESQLSFQLVDMDGASVSCRHELLSHVPWWSVKCGDRDYTVNTWMQINHGPVGSSQIVFMYDVSEGVRSSGEKLVLFRSHFTRMNVTDVSQVSRLSSDLDVRNGLATLNINVVLTR